MGTLSITDPVNGTANDATTIANANAAIKAVVNGNIDTVNLKDPGTGKVYGSTGAGNAAAVYPPGYELAYVETTTDTSVTVTTEASSTTVVTAGSVAYDGTAVMISFGAPFVQTPGGGNGVTCVLFDGTTSIGTIAQVSAATTMVVSSAGARRLTPSAATHTYSVRSFVGGGTGTIGGGAGGAGAQTPAFIRILKA